MPFRKMTVILSLAMLLAAAAPAIAAPQTVKVRVNEVLVDFPDQQPFFEKGRTYVPLRFVSDALGAEVGWQEKTETAVVRRGATEISMTIGSAYPLVNGQCIPRALDAKAYLKKGRTMVPLRFVSETFKADVQWEDATRTVFITDNTIPKGKAATVKRLEVLYGVTMIPSGAMRNSWYYEPPWEEIERNKDKSYFHVSCEEDGDIYLDISWASNVGDISTVQYDLAPLKKALDYLFPGKAATITQIMAKARHAADTCRNSGRFERDEMTTFQMPGYEVQVNSGELNFVSLYLIKK